jgi:hypothetical protein
LQRRELRAIERGGDRQVHARLGHPHDLDHRPAAQRDHLARPGCLGVQDMLGDTVQQFHGTVVRHPGHDELGPVVRGQPDRVRVGRPVPLSLYPLHDPAVPFEQLTQVLKVVVPGGPRMITLPAHVVTSAIWSTTSQP